MKRLSIVGLLLPAMAFAQEAPEHLAAAREWTTIEIVLSVALLIFSLLVLLMEAVIIMKAQKTWAPQSIMRVFGLTLIVSMAVLLVVAGYGKEQVGPVMGLLGVIAGYLLGNNDHRSSGP